MKIVFARKTPQVNVYEKALRFGFKLNLDF